MESKETIESGNRLIAEFMEDHKTTYGIPANRLREDMIAYHSSWDWLMPVVEKIEKETSTAVFHGFTVVIRRNHCAIMCHISNRQDGIICQTPYGTEPDSKIRAVWDMVVQFITWLNSQSNQQTSKKEEK
jgi:hypothetical protein